MNANKLKKIEFRVRRKTFFIFVFCFGKFVFFKKFPFWNKNFKKPKKEKNKIKINGNFNVKKIEHFVNFAKRKKNKNS